jgi:hypothetical protein
MEKNVKKNIWGVGFWVKKALAVHAALPRLSLLLILSN